jgi:hypothetical protein
VIECSVDRIALNPDSYALGITIRDRYDRIVWQGANVSAFSVVLGDVDRNRMPVHAALIYLPFTWSIPSLHWRDLRCDVVGQPPAAPSGRLVPQTGSVASADSVTALESSDGAELRTSPTSAERG